VRCAIGALRLVPRAGACRDQFAMHVTQRSVVCRDSGVRTVFALRGDD